MRMRIWMRMTSVWSWGRWIWLELRMDSNHLCCWEIVCTSTTFYSWTTGLRTSDTAMKHGTSECYNTIWQHFDRTNWQLFQEVAKRTLARPTLIASPIILADLSKLWGPNRSELCGTCPDCIAVFFTEKVKCASSSGVNHHWTLIKETMFLCGRDGLFPCIQTSDMKMSWYWKGLSTICADQLFQNPPSN